MKDFYKFLADYKIEYERHDHPAVYTVEEAERLVPPLPGAKSKNLFLRDKKGVRHFLVVVSAQKRVNIKTLPDMRFKSSMCPAGKTPIWDFSPPWRDGLLNILKLARAL